MFTVWNIVIKTGGFWALTEAKFNILQLIVNDISIPVGKLRLLLLKIKRGNNFFLK